MHFGFALDSSDIDLLDTDLDLLDTDISSKHFVCLQDVFQTCPEDVLKMSSALQFFVFQNILKNCYAEDMLKTSSRHVSKTSWRPTNVCWE